MKPLYFIPAVALALASCSDFLEIRPLNETVFDNFWTEEADVQAVVTSCYSGLIDETCTKRMFVWGEMRSDNVQEGNNPAQELKLIMQEEILTNSSYTKWDPFYVVINRCNTVLKYAPDVYEKDPNYTLGDLKAHIAEVKAIRALCYFYLVRAFRDVPYVTTPSDDDNNIEEKYRLPATPMKEVLKNIVADLEEVRDDAIKTYPENHPEYNSGRITRSAIDALLCDVYLWQGEYAKCCEAVERILEYKNERYEELELEASATFELMRYLDKYPLCREGLVLDEMGDDYNSIFGEGHSFESIFELGFTRNDNKNKLVSDFLGSSNGKGAVYANKEMAGTINKSNKYNSTLTFSYDDSRFYESIDGPADGPFEISKYVYQSCSFPLITKADAAVKVVSQVRADNTPANWIIYRLTDVMLMKAEALVEMAATEGDAVKQEAMLQEAFELVQVVNCRARKIDPGKGYSLVFADFNSVESLRMLVMDERRRELMFEGKRWFDMVRFALRWNDNASLINWVCSKPLDKMAAVRVKLATQDALFWPINRMELIVNPNLTQNPAYKIDGE